MLHKNKICESDIGRAVAEWLESRGYEVFHEARPFPDGRRNQYFAGDICNRPGIGGLVTDIDLWSDRAASVREMVRPDTIRFDARRRASPQMLDVIRRFRDAMRNALNEDQKNGVPGGSAGGGYSTPFSRTARCVAAIVARHGGINWYMM